MLTWGLRSAPQESTTSALTLNIKISLRTVYILLVEIIYTSFRNELAGLELIAV